MLGISVEFVVGLALLIWGSERFSSGSVAIARIFGVNPLLIGLTVVAFATSAPEILVSITASLHGQPDLAIGNAIGSNIVNIGLVLGLVAVIRPIQLNSGTVSREMSMLLAVSLLMVSLFLDAYVSRIDGVVMLSSLAIIMIWMTRTGLKSSANDPIVAELAAEIPEYTSRKTVVIQLVIGLATLIIGAELLVNSATEIAVRIGVSDVVIGIVLVAFGTSLPELAVSLASTLKGEYGLVLGNIVGSNIFNSLAVIGIAATIQPTALPQSVLSLHIFVMAAFTLALFASTYDLDGKQQISRAEGFSMLVAFVTYEVYTLAPDFID